MLNIIKRGEVPCYRFTCVNCSTVFETDDTFVHRTLSGAFLQADADCPVCNNLVQGGIELTRLPSSATPAAGQRTDEQKMLDALPILITALSKISNTSNGEHPHPRVLAGAALYDWDQARK